MNVRPEEISNVIKEQIKNYKSKIEMKETGTVILVGDGIARVYGLRECMASELLEFDDGSFGMAQNLESDTVSVALLSNQNNIREGSSVKRTGKVLSVPVGEAMLGRVVNALGEAIDGKGPIVTTATRPIESEAPGIIERKSVSVPLHTGIKAIAIIQLCTSAPRSCRMSVTISLSSSNACPSSILTLTPTAS